MPKIIVSIVVGICQLYLDYVNCIWIVRLYLDSKIVFGLCQLYLDCVNCSWIVLIVFGLCDCIWIVQLRDLAQGV